MKRSLLPRTAGRVACVAAIAFLLGQPCAVGADMVYPRRCVARRVDAFDKAEARRRLYAGAESRQGDFRLAESGDWPANETYFDVTCDAQWLYVSVMALESGTGGGSSPDKADAVEVLFDPLGDSLGLVQYGVDSLGTTYENTHWPYRTFEKIRGRDAPWKIERETDRPHEAPDAVYFYFFRFDLAMFQGRQCAGMNVCRWQGAIHEASSWNLVSGIGFPDPGCLGRLWLGQPEAGDAPTRSAALKPESQAKVTRHSSLACDHSSLACASGFHGTIPTTRLRLYGTYDWPDHVWNVPYSPGDLEREMQWYKDRGLERVYWLDYDSYALQAASGARLIAPSQDRARNLREAIRLFGTADFLPQAAGAAKKAGLELITLLKPFDLVLGDSFMEAHPEFTMRRNPAWTRAPQWPITAIRLFQHDDSPFPFRADSAVVWSGRDRDSYARVAGALTVRETVVQRPEYLWSPAGKIAGNAPSPPAPLPQAGEGRHAVRCLEISGLSLSGPWLAVEFPTADPGASLRNRQYLLAEVVDRQGRELFWRLAVHAGGGAESGWWRGQKWPPADRSWTRMDTGMDRLLTMRAKQIALEFSLDVPLYHGAILDPCFAEVRQHWLSKLRRGIDAGAQGVGVRIAHHVGCDDWLAYAFCEPVIQEFRKRLGRDPEPTNDDYTVVRRIRGEGFTRFLREARAMATAAGRKLCLHVESRMLVPPEMDCDNQIYWDWRTWIEEKLADEIDLKYIGPDHPAAREEIIPLARRHGAKINWISADPDPRSKPRSIGEAPLLADRASQAGLDGINLYELWCYRVMSKQGSPLSRGCAEPILRQLRKRIDELNEKRRLR